MRFLLRVTKRLQAAMPDTLPMFVRISATDWAPGEWDTEHSVEPSRRLKGLVEQSHIPVCSGISAARHECFRWSLAYLHIFFVAKF